MEISKYFKADNESKKKNEIFHEISKLAEEKKIVKKASHFYSALAAREKLSSTGMVDGIAIPHAISKKILLPSVTILKPKNQILDWETLDGSDVQFVICLSMPKVSESSHLDVLANISKKLANKEVRKEIIKENEENIWKILEI